MSKTGSLIIHVGDKDLHYEDLNVENGPGPHFVYQIGIGRLVGANLIGLNDPYRLNRYAEDFREEYVDWISSLTKKFKYRANRWNDLNLFGISDLSCKRSEFFETFSVACNIILIKDLVAEKGIVQVFLTGANQSFEAAILSTFPSVRHLTFPNREEQRASQVRNLASDILFGIFLFNVTLINLIGIGKHAESYHGDRVFFSIFPKLIDSVGQDKKYGRLCSDRDLSFVSIMTDGMHQRLSTGDYFKRQRTLPSRALLIDRYLKLQDVIEYFWWLIRAVTLMFQTRHRRYCFKEIDLSRYIREEVHLSVRRISRLIPFGRAFSRSLQLWTGREFVYYLHEYPIGRLMSYLLAKEKPRVKRIGVQHGPASWRKLLYFLGAGEGSVSGPYLQKIPIPDQVWAEGESSAKIYRHAGYVDVKVMDSISRLDYLSTLIPSRRSTDVLIAPGLHDGPQLLTLMMPVIQAQKDSTFFLKPHPLADNRYTARAKSQPNCVVSRRLISDLLRDVGTVYVTYSSVGPEARALGLDVRIVEIPGKISESPLSDKCISE